jgi:YjjG family noncanonical pyrimidine nucleotidase
MPYTTLLFDLDHTLLDSDASEAAAFAQTLTEFGVGEPQQHFAVYNEINKALWAQVETGALSPDQVKTARFEQFAAAIGLDADPFAMAERFALGLGANGELYPGAVEMLDEVSTIASLGLVTNGLSAVQRARIERLDLQRYFAAIVISAEVGTAKPGTAIFDLAFDQMDKPPKKTALMIGDSLSSDIRGGKNYGIATCWYNPHDRVVDGSHGVDHTVRHLAEIPALVRR